ncbi:hypothetical protein Tco_0599781 [Tanacetum coccineum]
MHLELFLFNANFRFGGNYGGNKHIKSVLVKPKTQYVPKAKQSNTGTSPKMAPPAGTNKDTTSGYNKESPSNNDNDDEVEHVENETASFLASSGVGYGPKRMWEQWRDTKMDNEYDPYDVDMYKGQEIPENIQTICDNFYIKFLGRKKK